MSRKPSLFLSLLVVATLSWPVACNRQSSPEAGQGLPAGWTRDTIAAVNGIAITEADVKLVRGSSSSHARPAAPVSEEQAVDALITQELAAQRAVELGLDQEPEYQAELARLTAQVSAFRRQRLSTVFFRKAGSRASITDDEAREYFNRNSARIRTELHVEQILLREERDADQVAQELVAGTPFEEAARKRSPELLEGQSPLWDLGYLRWNQVPEAWRPVIDKLAPGAVSGLIRGPNRRYWVIKLIDRREAPGITFESARASIIDQLAGAREVAQREQAIQDLRRQARIVRRAAAKPVWTADNLTDAVR